MATTSAHCALAFWDGLHEAATFSSGTSVESAYPLTNLGNNRLWSRVRFVSGALSAVQITIDAGATVTANVFAVPGHNLTSAATRRFQASTVSNFASTTIDTGGALLPCWDTSLGHLMADRRPWGIPVVYVNASTVDSRYFRWTFTDAANPAGYLEFGIALFGAATQFRLEERGLKRVPKKAGAVGAEIYRRRHGLSFSNLTAGERAKLESLVAGLGSTRRVMTLSQPLDASTYKSDAVWGTVEGDVDFEVVARSWPRLYTADMTVVEADW